MMTSGSGACWQLQQQSLWRLHAPTSDMALYMGTLVGGEQRALAQNHAKIMQC